MTPYEQIWVTISSPKDPRRQIAEFIVKMQEGLIDLSDKENQKMFGNALRIAIDDGIKVGRDTILKTEIQLMLQKWHERTYLMPRAKYESLFEEGE